MNKGKERLLWSILEEISSLFWKIYLPDTFCCFSFLIFWISAHKAPTQMLFYLNKRPRRLIGHFWYALICQLTQLLIAILPRFGINAEKSHSKHVYSFNFSYKNTSPRSLPETHLGFCKKSMMGLLSVSPFYLTYSCIR